MKKILDMLSGVLALGVLITALLPRATYGEWFTDSTTVPGQVFQINMHGAAVNPNAVVIAFGGLDTSGSGMRHPEDVVSSIFLDNQESQGNITIIPFSGNKTVDNETHTVWAYWNNSQVYGIISIIDIVRFHYPDTKIILHGGSAGAIMTARIITELARLGKQDKVQGALMFDPVNPYAITADGSAPGVFDGYRSEVLATYDRYKYWGVDEYAPELAGRLLGLPNDRVRITIPVYIGTSYNDPVINNAAKEAFNELMQDSTNTIVVEYGGEGHSVSDKILERAYLLMNNL